MRKRVESRCDCSPIRILSRRSSWSTPFIIAWRLMKRLTPLGPDRSFLRTPSPLACCARSSERLLSRNHATASPRMQARNCSSPSSANKSGSAEEICDSASLFDPQSASNFDPDLKSELSIRSTTSAARRRVNIGRRSSSDPKGQEPILYQCDRHESSGVKFGRRFTPCVSGAPRRRPGKRTNACSPSGGRS